ncbi:MAG: T9SS type A sorting domain-containing protein [Opitutaceae bacterium]|nr:T9SS type A sorting domain-containing protein [Cytophagales bacterium]
MIKRTTLILSFILFISTSWCFGAINKEIAIDQESHSLVAPEGQHYQWYKNGEIVNNGNSKVLQVSESGTYEVDVVDETGNLYRQEAIVGVTATGAIIKIYTIGDSTVQDYTAGYYPRRGYGQELPFFFNAANVQVINKGAGGTSSKSFYENQWPAIRSVLQPGDFVFIAFGINDRNTDPLRYAPTSVNGGPPIFEGFLTNFINDTKAKGAFPVLVTPSRRGSWQNGQPYDAWHDHPIAVRNVAKSLGVPLIDLDAKQKVVMQLMGAPYIARFWHNIYEPGEYPNYPNGSSDDLHLQQLGAIEAAKMICDGIKELSADKNVSTLIPYLKPLYEVKVASNLKASDSLMTRTFSYPAGITVTMKTIPKKAQLKNFLNWYDGANKNVALKTLYSFMMGSAPTSYLANFKGGVITGLEEIQDEKNQFKLYPNPFSESVNIEQADAYLIYDAAGTLLEKGACINNCQIGKNLTPGIYVIEIHSQTEIKRLKITKQ